MKANSNATPAGRPRRKLLWWALGALAFYTLFGFLILPLIVRSVVVKRLARELNREVAIENVRLNPFALSGAIRGLRIKDPDGETLLGWDEARANFQLASFFGRPWVFSEVAVSNPVVRMQVNRDHTLNFSDLIEKFAKTGPAKPSSQPVALRVDQLRVVGARAVLADLTPRQPFRRVIGPVEISLNDFHTDPDNQNPHTFTGSTDTGEVFSWTGRFSVNPIRADGEFSVANVALNKFAPLYQDLVRFEIRDGVANLHAAYRIVASAATNRVTVTNLSLALRSLKLAEPGATENLLDLPELVVSDVNADLMARAAEVGSVSVRGASLNVRRSQDASLNLLEMARPADHATNAPGAILFLLRSVTNAFSMLLESTNVATGLLRELKVEDCAVTLLDQVPGQPVRLHLDHIALSAKHLSNRPGTNLTASLALRWNTNGTVKTDVSASLFPLTADLRLLLDRVELSPLNPYLEPFVNVFVLGSKLGLDGRVQLRTPPDQLPVVTFKGDSRLDEFSAVDGGTSEELLRWGSLRIEGIEANLNPPAVSVARVKLSDAVARIVLQTNRTLNVLSVLRSANTNLPTPAVSSPPAAQARKVDAGKAFAQVKQLLGSRTNALAPAGLPAINVASIEFTNTHLQLADRSITPPVMASLQQIHGAIQGLSSDELRRAQFHLAGLVNNTGPVEVTGQFSPLNEKTPTEIQVVFKDVALAPADPYSGKFLGYRLAKGALSIDVSYQMSARHLKGRNLIVLDQFTLGDKVNSPDATKLPVRLGIALLKDRSGKIELDVPVEGNLDDPEFKLGRVIWHVIGNVFTKAVTSPFALLGSMFGGGKGEEIQFQEFEVGRSELLPAARGKLDTMAKALYERPGLQLEIEGHMDSTADADALRRLKLDQQLRVQKWKAIKAEEQAATTPEQILVTPDERTSLLRALYLATVGQATAPTDAPKPEPTLAPAAPVAPPPATATNLTRRVVRSDLKGAEVLRARTRPSEMSQPIESPKALFPSPPRSETNALAQSKPGNAAPEAPSQMAETVVTPIPEPEEMERRLLTAITVSGSDLEKLISERAIGVRDYLLQTGKVQAERVLLAPVSSDQPRTNGHRVYLQLR